jgi:hypothetical protein
MGIIVMTIRRFILTLLMGFFLVGCGSADESSSDESVDGEANESSASNSLDMSHLGRSTTVGNLSTYNSAYFTFIRQISDNNFQQDNLGNWHLAVVENFDLYYISSTDKGKKLAEGADCHGSRR